MVYQSFTKKITGPFLVRNADLNTHIYTEAAKTDTGLLATSSATKSVLHGESY
jgi:hypothetical protein